VKLLVEDVNYDEDRDFDT